MPFVYMGQVKRPRPGPRGVIKPGKAFNHFPEIMAAWPRVVEAIVIETTQELGAISQALAPTIQHQRRGDPAPGNLKASMKVRFYHSRASALVQTGRVEFPAVDPRGHRYAKPLETGSIRKTRKGLKRVPARPFLVDAIVAERRVFLSKLGALEDRLPR